MSSSRRALAANVTRRAGRRSSVAALLLAMGCVALTGQFDVHVRAAVALTAVAPLGASAGVSVQVTGTGFDPVASNNTVTLTPQGGAAVSLVAETIVVLDAATGLRRIGITVPAGLPVGPAAVLVRNSTTNESAGGRTLQIVQISLPQTNSAARGATGVQVRIDGSSNVQFVAGRTTPTFGAGITVTSTQVLSPTSLIATVSVSSTTSLGPRTVRVVTSTQTAQLASGFTLTAPNRSPTITSTPVTTADESQPYVYQVAATDPDGDALAYRLVSFPSGMTMAAGLISWTPDATHVGSQSVVAEATDGRGGAAQQSFQITVAAAAQLQAIDVQPGLLRFSEADATRPLAVTGLRTNGTTVDLTSPASGTTYQSSNAFVARVAADGTVTSVANGSATITARNGSLSDTAAVDIELGVTLDSLELTPGTSTLRSPGSTQALTLRGRFSDGSIRDLTSAAGTTYESSNAGVASVGATGVVAAIANGQIVVTARHDTRSATAGVVVNISSGVGFLRGEAFDDSRGLPLGHVTVSLLSDGGGPLATPVDVVANERGQFAIAGRAGDAVVRIAKAGYTSVERRVSIPTASSTTMFDARLTPIDPQVTLVSSAVGGQARNQSGRATLQVPPGGLATDHSVSLTVLSPQGLAALLPAGWSPITAIAIGPASLSFGFPLTLTLPNPTTLPQGLALTLARYDTSTHEWVAAGTATIDAGGLTLRASVERAGQFALLVPDAPPFTPADPTPGAPLSGVDRPLNQTTGVTAVGEVVPRSAPPGAEARALGRIGVTTPAPAPSGTFIQARVSERFDLLDQTQVLTQPFTQDLVSYATPRQSVGGTLGASFPITPSRTFTIQELMLGVVRLDVTPYAGDDGAAVAGPDGGTVTSLDGDTLQIPPGAMPGTAPIGLRRLSAAEAGIVPPAYFDLLTILHVDLLGAGFSAPAMLSTPAIGGVTAADQVLVARAFTDPFGQRRLELVAIGELAGGRLVTRTTIGAVSLAGVRGGGEFAYLRAQQPVGFLIGTVSRAAGAPLAGVLVTSDSVGIADVTGADGGYVVAGRIGLDTALRTIDAASGDRVASTVRLDTPAQILTVNLSLSATGPTVVAISPAAGATAVALDTSVTVDFSEALNPASVSPATITLQASGITVPATLTLSADGRRVVVRPSAPLAALTTHTVQITAGVTDPSGNPLTGYTPVSFTTLDPSRPAGPAPGRIVAELPDEGGFVLITGAAGVAAGGSAVTVINVRTQETATVLALADGSFRLRIAAVVGDELTLILRGADGRDATIAITQFAGADGSVSVGAAGGVIDGTDGRIGRILPRALAAAGTFRIAPEDAVSLPVLPAGFSYADSFVLWAADGAFRTLTSITLTESQNRFAPASTLAPPFAAAGELTTPPDALVNSTLRFTAVAQDADGVRRTVGASTAIVAGTPDTAGVETSHATDFPTLFVSAPREALPAQQVGASAVAPAARIDLEAPLPAGVQPTDTLLLAQQVSTTEGPRLAVVDQFSVVPLAGAPIVRTTGRVFPGMTTAGHYAIVSTHDALVFVTGIVSGAQATVMVEGLPFVFSTSGPNGRFIIPVRANTAFTLRFIDGNGIVRGTTSGQAPAAGSADVGDPLGPTAGLLTVTGDPNERSIVDINVPLVLRFSEPVDASTLSSALVVTDDAGSRVYGRIAVEAHGLSASFTPQRRWRFGTLYRYGVGTTVLARSGARLRAPFSSRFTTFAPSVVGSLALGETRDVAVAAGTAVVATDTGVTTVDVASPRAPRALGHVSIPGGANGVTTLSGTPIVDRNGQSHAGPIALVAAGGPSTAGSLRSFDLATPASPAALGATQLTNASGQTAPAGVPAFVGTPSAVVAGTDGFAFVAIDGVGASSVQIGQAIPLDAAVPARGAGPRHPAAGAESANDVARLGDRLLVSGVAGLTVLDAATMHRVGGVSTTGDAQGIAALAAFGMDVSGDGVIAPSTEVFDLAVVANGLDGTLQFYRVPETGDPVLLSAVRFAGDETTDVQVDGTERLAYVALGARGLAIVDLDGPASVQPIDGDRNGIDDRVLGVMDTTGTASRLTLDLRRGLAYGAGSYGLAVLQLLPPRTRFLTLKRDPVRVVTGEEQSMLESGVAFLTDDAMHVAIDVNGQTTAPMVLAIEESTPSGQPMLGFAGGVTAMPLVDGLNEVVVDVDHAVSATTRTARLVVRTAGGDVIAGRTFTLEDPRVVTAGLEQLVLGPARPILTASQSSVQVGVAGVFADGTVLNLTSPDSGTSYGASPTDVASVDAHAIVTGLGGGAAEITAINESTAGRLWVLVQRSAVLTGLQGDLSHLTLRAIGDERPLGLTAVFSDGTRVRDLAQLPGLLFTSSDANVASVDSSGNIRAIAAGTARISARSGTYETGVDVAVDPRTPSTITAVSIAAPSGSLSLDDAPIVATASVTGQGALDGLSVNVVLGHGTGSSTFDLSTDLTGNARIRLDYGVPGPVSLTVTVVDPATGLARTATRDFVLTAGSSDLEPNGDAATAPPFRPGRAVHGALDGTSDTVDSYRVDTSLAGTLEIEVQLPTGFPLQGVELVVRSASGAEISRLTVATRVARLTVPVDAAGAIVTLESRGAATNYRVTSHFVQGDVAISSVTPSSGAAGTLVTIAGAGFSTALGENQVFFSGVAADVVSATSTQLQARVPANAVSGAVTIIAGDRRIAIPFFDTGSTAAAPTGFLQPFDPSARRLDPTTEEIVDVTRLLVTATPAATRQSIDALAQRLQGQLAGYVPLTNQYTLQFPQNRTLDGLNGLRQEVALDPNVRSVTLSYYYRPSSAHDIDIELRGGEWSPGVPRTLALEQIQLFKAIDLARTTPPFVSRAGLREVRFAVIDTGFLPRVPQEFVWNGQPIVEYLESGPIGVQPATHRDLYPVHGHGTPVTSIIGAINDGTPGPAGTVGISGVLNSLLRPSERPFSGVVYGSGGNQVPSDFVIRGLADIWFRGDIDVVNISSGSYVDTSTLPTIRALRGRTLVVAAAGNDGLNESHYPARFSKTEPNVLSVAAVNVVPDLSRGIVPDSRADLPGLLLFSGTVPVSRRCQTLMTGSSNCSSPASPILIAAPGRDVAAIPAHSDFVTAFTGTSAAAPVVSGVAGILQAIRPTGAPLPPSVVRDLLTSTATDITGVWTPGDMVRLDAFEAVRKLLNVRPRNSIYVSDHDAETPGVVPGTIISMEVDPLSGSPNTSPSATHVIDLDLEDAGQTLSVGHPRTIVASPDGNWIYVFAEARSGYGDGVAVVGAGIEEPIDFIALSGAVFPRPAGTALPPPFHSPQARPPMVVSKDGRLLYVAAGLEIRIINTDRRRIVTRFTDLPSPYNAMAGTFIGGLQSQLASLKNRLASAGATAISALELSPDGTTLYIVIQRGSGAGSQPGTVLPVNVDLYRDGDTVDGLQSRLDDYLAGGPPLGGAFPATRPTSDEPSDAIVSPDGKYLYLVNGGVDRFSAPSLDGGVTQQYAQRVAAESTSGVIVVDPSYASAIERDLRRGVTVAVAPGVIEAFDLALAGAPPRPRFTADVNHGWQPSAESGGLVLSPSTFARVFSKRPYSITARPDGRRALVAFFQTGNFGVLDMTGQEQFPANLSAPPDTFTGIVGVTPAVSLDNNLWPYVGAFEFNGMTVPSPDERLMFPTQVEYSQNGRFAVGVHTGVAPVQTDPFVAGGGAVSIISDDAITADLAANAASSPPVDDAPRPFYAQFPVCAQRLAGTNPTNCSESAVTTLYNYSDLNGRTGAFGRPRGVAIAPIARIVGPAFLDHVTRTTEIRLEWSSPIDDLSFEVFDNPPPSGPEGSPVSTGHPTPNAPRSFKTTLDDLLDPARLIAGHRYRIRFTLSTAAGVLTTVSTEVVLIR